MSDTAIHAEGLGKAYRKSSSKAIASYKTLQEDLIGLLRRPFRHPSARQAPETFWALRDVSLDVKQGEVLGIIGRNGAGKSTLLKLLARITRPTAGYVDTYGRVGSLLEVGMGFHRELTGRENIFLNGAILGMSRRAIRQRFDEIVAFAGVEQFLDTPVKHYSSGMYARLAFSVAAHLDTEVLLVDEVLAVGDAEFQKKSLGKMENAAQAGRTVLFVSHQMNAIQRLCPHCIWLNAGRIMDQGPSSAIISKYLTSNSGQSQWCAEDGRSAVSNPYFNPLRFSIVDEHLQPFERDISADEKIGVLIEGEAQAPDISLKVGFAVYAISGELLLWSLHTDVAEANWPPIRRGVNKLVTWIPPHFLNEGSYRVELNLSLHLTEWLSQPGVNAPGVEFSIRGGLSESPYWMMVRPGLLGPILPFEIVAD